MALTKDEEQKTKLIKLRLYTTTALVLWKSICEELQKYDNEKKDNDTKSIEKKVNIIKNLNDEILQKNNSKTYIYLFDLQNQYLTKKINCKDLIKNSNIQSLKNLMETVENPGLPIDENYIKQLANSIESIDYNYDTLNEKCLNRFKKYINNRFISSASINTWC